MHLHKPFQPGENGKVIRDPPGVISWIYLVKPRGHLSPCWSENVFVRYPVVASFFFLNIISIFHDVTSYVIIIYGTFHIILWRIINNSLIDWFPIITYYCYKSQSYNCIIEPRYQMILDYNCILWVHSWYTTRFYILLFYQLSNKANCITPPEEDLLLPYFIFIPYPEGTLSFFLFRQPLSHFYLGFFRVYMLLVVNGSKYLLNLS